MNRVGSPLVLPPIAEWACNALAHTECFPTKYEVLVWKKGSPPSRQLVISEWFVFFLGEHVSFVFPLKSDAHHLHCVHYNFWRNAWIFLDQLKLERGDLFCAKPYISGKLSEKWYFSSLSSSYSISSEHSGFWWRLLVIWRCPLAHCLVLIGRVSGSFLMSKGSTIWVINAMCMVTTGREGLISGFQSLVKYFS